MIIVEALIFISYYAVVRLKVYKIRLWRHLTVVIIASAVMGIAAYALYNFHPVLSSFLAGILYLFVLIIWDRDFRKVGTYALRSVLSLVGRS